MRLSLVASLCLLLPAAAHASAPWVARPGARALAMGGVGAIAAEGVEAMAQDPAALLMSSGWSISHTFWAQDLRADQAAVAYRRGNLGLGLQLDLQEAPGVELRAPDGRWLGSRTLRREELGLVAAFGPGLWRLGLRGVIVQGDLDSSRGYAGLGAQFRPWRWLSLGGALDLQEPVAAWRASVEMAGPWRTRVAGGVLQEDPDRRFGFGMEWEAIKDCFLRAGWQMDAQRPAPSDPASLSLGVAVPLSLGQLAYAWSQVGPLGQAHRLQWSTAFQAENILRPGQDLSVEGLGASGGPTATATATLSPSPTLSNTPPPELVATATPSPSSTATPLPRPSLTPSPQTPKKPVNLRFVIP